MRLLASWLSVPLLVASQTQLTLSVTNLKPGVYLVQNGGRAQRLVVE